MSLKFKKPAGAKSIDISFSIPKIYNNVRTPGIHLARIWDSSTIAKGIGWCEKRALLN